MYAHMTPQGLVPDHLRKVPDEDPFPCGGREKLRDEKFKWKPGDAFEFIGRVDIRAAPKPGPP